MNTTDDVVEDEADDGPGDVVDSRAGRDAADAGEQDGDVDVAEEREGVAAGEEVEGDGEESTDEEEPTDGAVTAWRKKKQLSISKEEENEVKTTYICPGLNNLSGPIPPQIKLAVANVSVLGQTKPAF
jgi:hypothetical protein